MRNLLLGLKNAYGNRKFRTKIIINFLIINLIITVSVGIIYYLRAAKIIEEELTKNVDYSISRLSLDISSVTDRINEISNSITTNTNIRKMLMNSSDESGFEAQIMNYIHISDIYNSMPYNPAIYQNRIYLKNSFDNNKQQISFLNIKEASATNWYRKVNQLNGKIYWTNSYDFRVADDKYEKLISCSRVIKDYNQADRVISYISIDIKERYIYGILNQAEKAIGGEIYLIGDNNEIISCKDTNMIGKNIESLNGFSLVEYKTKRNVRMVISGKDALVISDYLPDLNWNIVTIVSMQNFVNKTNKIFISLLQVSVIAFILSLVLAAILSENITGRIRKLIDYIHKVDIEKNVVPLDVTYKDEISELINAFNTMVYQNHILVNEVYQKSLEKKSADIKVLQAQINPHFLYNALDTANWMAHKYKAKDIMKFLKMLSNFYRLSLSMGRSVVSINNEIEHVKSYIDIQKIKTNDEIEAIYNVSPEILSYSIPKLILQPIVENAIIHGIQEGEERKGLIEIEGSMNNSLIKFSIKDNGIGMDAEKLNEIRAKIQKESDNSGSYGLRNVNQRIKHYFGDEYGINISSEYGNGTIVEVLIPATAVGENDLNI